MIVIDYFNFLYCRYSDITEELVKKNLKYLSNFFADKNIYVKIIFDGIRFQHVSFANKNISLIFSADRSADDIIIDLFRKLQGKSHTLISRDRRLGASVKRYANSRIMDPYFLWKELDLFYKNPLIGPSKKSGLIKMTDFTDDLLDALYKKIK